MGDRSRLGFWNGKEVRLEAAHILDLVDAVLNEESKQVTPFLSFAMLEWAEAVLRKEHLALMAEGGFQDSERVRIIIAHGVKPCISQMQKCNLTI